jgi:tetratricopeptide (TPR) repeat protein
MEASFNWSARCREAYASMTMLNFNKTRQLLAEEKKADPDNLVPLYIENQAEFLSTFISEEESAMDKLRKNTAARIDKIEKGPASRYKLLFTGEMYLQLAIGRIKFGEYLLAANDLRKANRQLNENQKKYPDFTANLRGLGFIHTVAGTVPKNYQWISSMLGVKGSVSQGLSELSDLLNASSKDPQYAYLKDETILLLTFLELNLDKNKQNTNRIRQRFTQADHIESKPLLQFAKAVFHFWLAENDSVIELLGKRKNEPGSFPLMYLDFMEGSARLNKMDFTGDKNFEKYIQNYKGKSYICSAWQRRAWIRLLQNDAEGYHRMMSNCKNTDPDKLLSDEDKQAVKDARSGILPNKTLLKGRLYFDGGYYLSALTEIGGKPPGEFPSLNEKLELTYRLARIFDKTGKKDKAIYYYKETYRNGQSSSSYFAANSSLMLGRLYEDLGENQLAIEYYKKTLELRNHDFQNSIDQKAKAGILRLE